MNGALGIFRLCWSLRLFRQGVGQIISRKQGGSLHHHIRAHVLGVDCQEEGLRGVDDAHIIDGALKPAVLVRHLIFLRHTGLEVLSRLRLLHVAQHFLKIGAVVVEVGESVEHHSGAVVVVHKIDVLDFLVGHGEVLAHQIFIGAKITEIV